MAWAAFDGGCRKLSLDGGTTPGCASDTFMIQSSIISAGQNDESCLVIGTSAGWLQLHSDTGTLLHRQQLHTLPVLRLHARYSIAC